MGQRIFVTGGSGFVGAAIIEQLLARGYEVNALVNRSDLAAHENLRIFKGGLFDPAALDAGLKDCDAVIHVVPASSWKAQPWNYI